MGAVFTAASAMVNADNDVTVHTQLYNSAVRGESFCVFLVPKGKTPKIKVSFDAYEWCRASVAREFRAVTLPHM
jgi:hypothetical protein